MSRQTYGSISLRSQSVIEFFEAAAGGTNFVSLKAPAALGSNIALTLPATAPAASEVITSDGSGNLSFAKIADANVATAAAIAVNKLAALTASRAVASDASGFLTPSATTSAELAFVSGVTSAIQTQLNGKASTALSNLTVSGLTSQDLLVASSSSAVVRLAVGTEGQVLKVVSGVVAWGTDNASSKFAANWITADGTTKAITHSLATKDIHVEVYDKTDDSTIQVDSIVRTDTNTVTLTSSEAPGAAGWRVVILA